MCKDAPEESADRVMDALTMLCVEPCFVPLTLLARDLGMPVKRGRYHDGPTVGDLLDELTQRGLTVVTRNARGEKGMVAAIAKEAWGRAQVAAENYWAATCGNGIAS